MNDEEMLAAIRAAVREELDRRVEPRYVDMRGLSEYSGWGYGTVKRLSASNRIPGKRRHDGKVTFDLREFDEWLRTEHNEGPLVALPHEQR